MPNYTRADIPQLYVERKMSIPQIAEVTGIPRSTVRNTLVSNGVKFRSSAEGNRLAGRKNSPIDSRQRERIVPMYVELKMSLPEIAQETGLTVGAIGSILKVRGIELRSPKEAQENRWPNGRHGEAASNWRGGIKKSGAGYLKKFCPVHPYADSNGYVMEHRLVMEKQLGRFLDPKEDVHHINEIKDDNRSENLMVVTRSQHKKIHALLKQANNYAQKDETFNSRAFEVQEPRNQD